MSDGFKTALSFVTGMAYIIVAFLTFAAVVVSEEVQASLAVDGAATAVIILLILVLVYTGILLIWNTQDA
jgi:hypothetical protein